MANIGGWFSAELMNNGMLEIYNILTMLPICLMVFSVWFLLFWVQFQQKLNCAWLKL